MKKENKTKQLKYLTDTKHKGRREIKEKEGERKREDHRKPPSTLTDTAWLVAGPLVVVLARDAPLPHQLERRLAGERQLVAVQEALAAAAAERRHPGVSAATPLDLWTTQKKQTPQDGAL